MTDRAALTYGRQLVSTAIVVGALSACGSSLAAITTEAMDSCIAARNPVFTSGHGADALKTPLSEGTRALAMKVRYDRGFKILKSISEHARDQVTLVCALDLMSYNSDADTRAFIQQYLKHPSPDVALNAKLLLDRPIPNGL